MGDNVELEEFLNLDKGGEVIATETDQETNEISSFSEFFKPPRYPKTEPKIAKLLRSEHGYAQDPFDEPLPPDGRDSMKHPPAVKLFMQSGKKNDSSDEETEESVLDVEYVDEESTSTHVSANVHAQSAMLECERNVSLLVPLNDIEEEITEETSEKEEEEVNRSGWNKKQNIFFNRVETIFDNTILAEKALAKTKNEAYARRAILDRTSTQFYLLLIKVCKSGLCSWFHETIMKTKYFQKTTYLNILQSLHHKCPELIDSLIAASSRFQNYL